MQNPSNTENTFTLLKTDTELTRILNYQFFELSNKDIILKLKNLKYGFNSIENFTNEGMYYKNPLIFAIENYKVNTASLLLKHGSASRGYIKYPGYPLYCAINKLFNELNNDINFSNKGNLILIIESLVSHGARFDDYVVHIFWFKLDSIFEKIDEKNSLKLRKFYDNSPFDYIKYERYLDTYCKNFIFDCKKQSIEKFLTKYPKKNKLVRFKVFFF